MTEAPIAAPLRLMYDSAHMDAIPASAQIVAGYPHRGGDTVWNPGRFPRSLVMAIDQHGNHPDDCHAADYEAFAIFGAAMIRQWVITWHQLHPHGLAAVNGWFSRPPVYCDLANLATVRGALAGLLWDEWVAEWPGPGPVLLPGSVAHQYASQSTGSGGDFDLSVVAPSFGMRPPPPPPSWESTAYEEALGLARYAAILADLLRAHLPLP